MKCTLHNSKSPVITTVSQTKTGDLMVVVDKDLYTGDILFHSNGVVISLSNPMHVWTKIEGNKLEVRLLEKGEYLTLTPL